MSKSNQNLLNLLELANQYPSPHNGQPIRLKPLDANTYEIYFDRGRGLQATEISFLFSFVSVGVFIEHLSMSSQALGHSFKHSLKLPKQSELKGVGLVKVATCTLEWETHSVDDGLIRILNERQTSRKKYYEDVDKQTAEAIADCAQDNRTIVKRLSKDQTKQAIWLNQRAVFDDMFDEPVRQELNHWLRYSRQQKESKKDGLAYDCMELNGGLMKRIVDHPRVLKTPGLSSIIKRYYLRTMTDSSSVFYMLAPFDKEFDAYRVGEDVMRIWKLVAQKGYYLHPFGTIMSNKQAHQDFLKLAGVEDESRQDKYLVFIFRCGKSSKPVPSLRIPVNEHLLMEPT
jgi:hypothetical protein